MKAFDVGIIGAGVHGASVAFHLASRGVRAIVFEKGVPAGGPTGVSSGVCRAYYTNEFLARAARDSIAMLANFSELTGGDAGFRRTGFLFLHPANDVGKVRETSARLNAQGIAVEVLDRERLTTEFPAFDLEGVAAGVWEEGAGYADPASTTLGLIGRAVELGAVLRPASRVTRIEPSPGGGATVTAQDGTAAACGRLLIAAGPWTAALARQVGVELPLTVERHVVGVFGWGGAERLPFGHADLTAGYYCKPEGEELFLLGWLRAARRADPDDFPAAITREEAEELGNAAARRVPSLVAAEARRGWAGLYDMSPDWQPVIGEIAEGIFVDAGTSGHGFKLAPALGRHIADLLMGETPDPGLAQFHPARFAGGGTLAAGYRAARILG